jgi:hypothetical protein
MTRRPLIYFIFALLSWCQVACSGKRLVTYWAIVKISIYTIVAGKSKGFS